MLKESRGPELSSQEAQLIADARTSAVAHLLEARGAHGHWEGRLSSSALSTATACIAFSLHGRATSRHSPDLTGPGLNWLREHQNSDGGWGDTTDSPSNVSTTLLAWVALGLEDSPGADSSLAGCEEWLKSQVGDLSAESLSKAVGEIYGEDRTFAVPIQVTCALGGRFGSGSDAWRGIPALPFELAALPHQLFSRVGLPMVSYAMPALIAIGHVIDAHRSNWNPVTRLARAATRTRTLRTLEAIQPTSGGFLEATPLTSFVCLSLVGCGRSAHPVVKRGLEFLRRSVRPDGSWPIDTNLATWVTDLAVDALAGGGNLALHLAPEEQVPIRDWVAGQQYRVVHPYTHAAPGGWAWTDLAGGVPDADDTPAALLALAHMGEAAGRELGVRWLVNLQNRDGGIPTFCRGWGKLPFDRSCPDLTAHALRAFAACADGPTGTLARARDRATGYLIRVQREDGAWLPLWFGNQHSPTHENPVYGTSRVLKAAGVHASSPWDAAMCKATRWLLSAQHVQGSECGGFGGDVGLPPSIEETGLALEALAAVVESGRLEAEGTLSGEVLVAVKRGALWLARATEGGTRFDTTPIGLYFAKLWYSETLYPLIFTVAALERCAGLLEEQASHGS